MQPEMLDPVPAGSFFEAPAITPPIPFWNYFDLLQVLGLTVAALIVIMLSTAGLAVLYPSLTANPAPLLLPVQFAVYGALYVELLLVFRVRYDQPVLRSLGWRRSSFNLGVAVLGGSALAFLISFIASLLRTPQVASPMDKLMNSPGTAIQLAIIAIIAAPFFEELFFRGFIQPLLSRTFGVVTGVIITSVAFGALHAPEYAWAWQYALAVSLAGAAFGWVRVYSNSIIPGTVMHACYNAVFVIAAFATKNGKH